MLCARCNSENSASARYCNACGSPLARCCPRCGTSLASSVRFCEACGSPVETLPSAQPDKPPGSALTPRGTKEFDTPLPLAEFRQTAIQTDPASLPTEAMPQARRDSLETEPRPLYVKPIPTSKPAPVPRPAAGPAAELWQWGLGIASAAVFLYNASLAISMVLYGLTNSNIVSNLASQLVVSLALASAALCGLALALPDSKTTVTVIAGGILLRSLMALLFAATSLGARVPASFDWLCVSALAAGVLWWTWLQNPRARGDASRLSMALTVLVVAQALSAVYVFASHPSIVHPRTLATSAISLGALLGLRLWLPAAIGDDPSRALPRK
jgi:hypothetical protein